MIQFLQASSFFPRQVLLSTYTQTVMPSTTQAIYIFCICSVLVKKISIGGFFIVINLYHICWEFLE